MKKMAVSALTVSLLLLLCACGGGDGESAEPAEESIESAEVTEETAPMEKSVELVALDEDSVITHEGDYVLSGLYSDIITDASRSEGWFYYFSEGTESNVPWQEWEMAPGMYTSCELLFDMQNLMEEQTETFLQRFDGFIVYNLDLNAAPDCPSAGAYLEQLRNMASADTQAELFDLAPLQNNPGQVDADGYPVRSKDAVLLPYEETARQDLIADVSEAFVRSWENPDGTEPMWAVFSYDEDTVFTVDMRAHLVEYA